MTLVCLLGSGFAGRPAEPDEWREQMQRALNLESKGDFLGAERILMASISEAERPAADPLWLPTALDRLGGLSWDLGRSRQAQRLYLRAADLWLIRFGSRSLDLATTLSDLAWSDTGLGDHSRADRLWKQSLEIRIAVLGRSDPTVAQVYGYLAVAALAGRRLSDAESFCQQALQIYDRTGKIPGETSQVLSSLASVWLQQGRAPEAIQLIKEAIELDQTAAHPSLRLLGGYFYNLALAENAAARLVDAEVHFQHALSLLAGPPFATQALRRNILESYADFLSRAGRKKEAAEERKEASDIARVIRRESYADNVVDISLFH